MKRVFILLGLLAFAVAAEACGPMMPIHNYYIYYLTPEAADIDSLNAKALAAEWSAYTGRPVSVAESEALATLAPADLEHTDHPIVAYARARRDAEMLSYLRLLVQYCSTRVVYDAWEYPTEAELTERAAVCAQVERTARAYRGTRLADRYALLVLRCCFARGDYDEVLRYAQTKHLDEVKAAADNVFRRMARGYYAGALYRTHQYEAACAAFAALGDTRSARWCLRRERSLACIRSLFEQNPTQDVLPYLVQDFVNNAQETYDCLSSASEDDDPISYFYEIYSVSPIFDDEVSAFVAFASKAAEAVPSQSAMWWSAAAMCQYLQGHYRAAMASAELAVKGGGNKRMKDNARAVRLLVATAADNAASREDFERFLLPELLWLQDKAAQTDEAVATRWGHIRTRIIYRGLIPLYEQHYADATYALLWYALGDDCVGQSTDSGWNYSYSGEYFAHLDTVNLPTLLGYYDLRFNAECLHSVLTTWLLGHTYGEQQYFADIVGTRLMRAGRFEEALPYLYQLTPAFIAKQNIAPYVAMAHYGFAPWMQRQRFDTDYPPQPQTPLPNKKLDFCRDLLSVEQNYRSSRGAARVRWTYNLAVLYAQASITGDCWWLTHYGKSISDERDAEFDFRGRAYALLGDLLQATDDADYVGVALLGRVTLSPDRWRDADYDYFRDVMTYTYHPESQQYADYSALTRYAERHKVPEQLSRCSELRHFRQYMQSAQ